MLFLAGKYLLREGELLEQDKVAVHVDAACTNGPNPMYKWAKPSCHASPCRKCCCTRRLCVNILSHIAAHVQQTCTKKTKPHFMPISAGSAGARPEKRVRTETEAPAQNKRAAHPPYARGGYNSEEWVFDDDDEDEEMPPEHPDEAGGEDDGMADADRDLQDTGIRSLEASFAISLQFCRRLCSPSQICCMMQHAHDLLTTSCLSKPQLASGICSFCFACSMPARQLQGDRYHQELAGKCCCLTQKTHYSPVLSAVVLQALPRPLSCHKVYCWYAVLVCWDKGIFCCLCMHAWESGAQRQMIMFHDQATNCLSQPSYFPTNIAFTHSRAMACNSLMHIGAMS